MESVKSEPMVSIIVPIYNSAKYLSRCLDSLINQTYMNIEVILVDDGSNDDSYDICERYVSMDKRIRVYHKNNEGVAIARNYGLRSCIGEYVVFVDSDDYLISDHIYTLVDLVRDVTVPVIGCVDYYEEHNGTLITLSFENDEVDSFNCDDGILKIFEQSSYRGYLWNKIFSISEIRKYNITFLPGAKIWEDSLFVLEYMINTSAKVQYKHTPLYVYCIYPDSTMGLMNHSNHITMIECTKKLLDYPSLNASLYKIIVKLHADLLLEGAIFGTGIIKDDCAKEIKQYRKHLNIKKKILYIIDVLCPGIVNWAMKI